MLLKSKVASAGAKSQKKLIFIDSNLAEEPLAVRFNEDWGHDDGMYVYYYRTYEKAVSGGGEREKGGHVLRDTTSRGLYVRVWPPHTSERRGGGGGCEQEGWQGGEGRARISRWAGVARAPSLSHTCGHTGRARRTVLDWVVLR